MYLDTIIRAHSTALTNKTQEAGASCIYMHDIDNSYICIYIFIYMHDIDNSAKYLHLWHAFPPLAVQR